MKNSYEFERTSDFIIERVKNEIYVYSYEPEPDGTDVVKFLEWFGPIDIFINKVVKYLSDDDDAFYNIIQDREYLIKNEIAEYKADGLKLQDFCDTIDEVYDMFDVGYTEYSVIELLDEFWKEHGGKI